MASLYYIGGLNVEIVNADTDEIITTETPNSNLTSFNRDIRQSMLMGNDLGTLYTITDLDILYFGFGDDDTVFDPDDTTLYNEIFRKHVTSKTETGNVVTSVCALNSTEANFNIKEIGIFSGDNATSSLNTGNMLSRVLVDFTKNENIILNVYRYDITII